MPIVTCYNCGGARYVWNGYRNIACPVCGNRGELERVEQLGLFGDSRVHCVQIKPDSRRRVKP